jgi:hypothetical protein
MTWANARALGLTAARDNVSDASISFSNTFNWDFDGSNGIDANAFDFVGVATHEIGHALGFVSGVDLLDANLTDPRYPESAYRFIAPADLYRCSDASKAAGADLDWSADKRTKYFSLDHCTTELASFSTGVQHGDGRQASHWKDDLGLGIMDPTSNYGEHMQISANDIRMMDVIGWNVVPEPASALLMLAGVAGLAGARRRKA